MKKLIIISLGLLWPLIGLTQIDPNAYGYYIDALRFSTSNPTGSARIMGMGGANVSLGADVSTVYSNPAGLGAFNRSVFSLTPAYTWNKATSEYLGNSNESNENKFNFFNGGLVISRMKEDPSDDASFLGGSFGFTRCIRKVRGWRCAMDDGRLRPATCRNVPAPEEGGAKSAGTFSDMAQPAKGKEIQQTSL